MDSTQDSSQIPVQIGELLGQLAMELAFVAPDQDTGLLPINSILMDLEDALTQDAPSEVTVGVLAAKGWMDQTLDGNGKFSAETISNLTAWHAWMERALSCWERDEAISSMPDAWSNGSSKAAAPVAALPVTLPVPKEVSSAIVSAAAPADEELEEKAILLNLKDDAELLHEFHGESVELLQNIEQGLLVLEENPSDSNTINSIFRAFHTFKGGAGFLHLHALQNLAHDLESLLDAVRQSKLQINSPIINVILAGSDALKHYTHEIGHQIKGINAGEPIVVPTALIIRKVKAILNGESLPEDAPSGSINKNAAEVEIVTQQIEKPSASEFSQIAASAQATLVVPEVIEKTGSPRTLAKQDPLVTRPVQSQGKQVTVTESASGFVKLETWKLDALVDLVGELVIAQSMVVQDPDVQTLQSRTLARSLRQLSRTTSELQRNAMSLRMVPVRAAFQKMTRLVRDVGVQTGKQVQLILEGEDTELDRNIVEKLGDPLVHMIRNAVDHGIEMPEEREAKGKARLGTVRLSASHQRGGILIRIQDDGKGLNAEKLLAQGVKRGVVKEGAELSESEIFSLIFEPGFSTAEVVSDLSGRGVGMDVVKRNIESLRGKVEIHSVIGQGSTFNILLPLTLAIIDGMLVGVGSERFIIPTISVRESFRPRPGMVSTIHEKGAIVSVRGKQTPVLPLGKYLGIPTKATTPEEGIMIVVESGDASRAILVDELIGKQEVVIKSLGETFKDQNLLAGGAVLGDGSVGLILDVDTLVKL